MVYISRKFLVVCSWRKSKPDGLFVKPKVSELCHLDLHFPHSQGLKIPQARCPGLKKLVWMLVTTQDATTNKISLYNLHLLRYQYQPKLALNRVIHVRNVGHGDLILIQMLGTPKMHPLMKYHPSNIVVAEIFNRVIHVSTDVGNYQRCTSAGNRLPTVQIWANFILRHEKHCEIIKFGRRNNLHFGLDFNKCIV